MQRRVVVTGLGVASPIGCSIEQFWQNLISGKSGIKRISLFDPTPFDVKIAGEVRDIDLQKWIDPREQKRLDRFTRFTLYTASEAIADAKINFDEYDCRRIGVIIGSGIGGLGEFESQHALLLQKGPERVSPFFIPKLMMNSASATVAIKYGLKGANFAVASACSSGNHALGVSFDLIRRGVLDVVITGASEAAITPMGLAGFCALKALSKRNDAPEKASRPFDKNRDGFVIAEGAGCVVLEEYELAKKRGANIYAEVVGFAMGCDAYHITAPLESGEEAAYCMRMALADAKLRPEDITYINAHGTSTEYNDVMETRAIKLAFGEHAKKLAISSTKSMIGHSLGAASAIEFIACALTIKNNIIHPTINYEEPDPECDLFYVPNEAIHKEVKYAMSNSFGFGGHNTAIILGKI